MILCLRTREGLMGLAESCQTLTSQMALRPNEALFLEIGRSQALFSIENAVQRALEFAGELHLQPTVGIATDPATALAFSFYGAMGKQNLPVSALPLYWNPFVVDENKNQELARGIPILKDLGISNVGEFLALDSGALSTHLGYDWVRLKQYLIGTFVHLWPKLLIAERIVESIDFDPMDSVSDLERMSFVLKTLLDRTLLRVRRRGERVLELKLRLELESDGIREWSFQFAHGRAFLKVMRERLSIELQKNPLEASCTGVRIEVTESAPATTPQRHFFHRAEEKHEAFESLFTRLEQRLGPRASFRARPVARYLPEGAWARTAPALAEEPLESMNPLPIPERPTRLLTTPRPLLYMYGRLIDSRSYVEWKIKRWEGPERLSGEWWIAPYERDYYRVWTVRGEQLWIFKSPSDNPQMFLHGFFD